MTKCGFPGCGQRAVGGFEHHVYATASEVTPTIIDKSEIYWCGTHEGDLEDHVELPGIWFTEEDLDTL